MVKQWAVKRCAIHVSCLLFLALFFIVYDNRVVDSVVNLNSEHGTRNATSVDIQLDKTLMATLNSTSNVQKDSNKNKNTLPSSNAKMVSSNLSKTATVVVQLSGEMANNLQHIAHGVGLQWWLQEKGVDTNLMLRHYVGPNNRAPKPKWKSARNDILQCFPKLNWDFTAGNSKLFSQRQSQQQDWLGGKWDHMTGKINGQSPNEIEEGLYFLINEILTDPERPDRKSESYPLRLPFLLSESLDVFPMVDRYYDKLKKLFAFNDSCCALLPKPDESVFHFRNYQSELPFTRAYDMGFEELSPHKVAHEVFAKLQSGDKVAITTRIANSVAQGYVDALKERGIHARLVTGQTGVQDFCFLLHAQKELVGHARSTYVGWAALLGTRAPARFYLVDNFGIRQRHPNFQERFTYNWTTPELQRRVRFELYRSEEVERSNNNAAC